MRFKRIGKYQDLLFFLLKLPKSNKKIILLALAKCICIYKAEVKVYLELLNFNQKLNLQAVNTIQAIDICLQIEHNIKYKIK